MTKVLDPGSWGDLRVDNRVNIPLGAGEYVFCNVTIERWSYTYSPQARIWVNGMVQDRRESVVGAGPPSKSDTTSVQWFVQGQGVKSRTPTVKFDHDAHFFGNIFVVNDTPQGPMPAGIINLGNSTVLTGHFWADAIESDFDVTIPPPPGTPTTTTSSAHDHKVIDTTTTSLIPPPRHHDDDAATDDDHDDDAAADDHDDDDKADDDHFDNDVGRRRRPRPSRRPRRRRLGSEGRAVQLRRANFGVPCLQPRRARDSRS